MKKYIFLITITSLFIWLLLYFYDQKEELINLEYTNIEENIQIEYPYFNNHEIDNYINKYLNKLISDKEDYNLFIDYDYKIKEEEIYLTIFSYKYKEKIITKTKKNLIINNTGYQVIKNNQEDNIIYDPYKQKIINKDKKMIALTFDDGPNYNTNNILDILDKYNIKATFFILGTNINNFPQIIKRINNTNHEIGNHMYSHKLITKLKPSQIKKEISQTDTLIYNITGSYPTLIRPSYGTYNKTLKSITKRPIITWNIDTQDWKYHNSQKISKTILKNIKDGDIILMHDIYTATANSLEIIIPKLLENDYQFVTVSDLLYYKNCSNTTQGYIHNSCN